MDIEDIELIHLQTNLAAWRQECILLELELSTKIHECNTLESQYNASVEEGNEKDKLIADLMCIVSVLQEEQEEYIKW